MWFYDKKTKKLKFPVVEILFDSWFYDLHNRTFAFARLSIKMLFSNEYNCQ